ncbi:MAG: xanthine dehydrogenase family protein subunit M [Armatimonadota bacterium]|nr:xanthine dehydrogenase family protein subunit M [Armatimonadota bacterium]MDR7444599.1 xanthine dehydrogenase family protein subunit M [Armatimonadota bacterium]MDR7563840.1 xanthine dehydrogenase family protein subunit M [Armatimonadota bacterium]MDR7567226.1 xanthine dehydrogenase family protein subunit M [Armatimonadota bacterium]
MKPAPFWYVRPQTREEAVEALARHGEEAKILAGGQSLVPMMNLRLARPRVLVDINRIAGLGILERRNGELVLGALVRHRQLEQDPRVTAACPILSQAAAHIGYPAIRNRGTVGGSLAHADPAAELSCALLATGGTAVLESTRGLREVPIEDLFVGPYTTCIRPQELLVEVRVPVLRGNARWGFAEFARHEGGFALALAACIVQLDGEGRVTSARVALGGVGPVPVRLRKAEESLQDAPLSEDRIAEAASFALLVEGYDDVHAPAWYRRRLAGWVVRQALLQAARGGA